MNRKARTSLNFAKPLSTGWEAVIKDFVRSTYWSHQKGSSYWQVYLSDNISERFGKIKQRNCILFTLYIGGLKNRPTIRLITWLIVARFSGQKGCSSERLYRTSYTKEAWIKFLQLFAFLIFIQRYLRGTITWKLIDFYWHN